MIEKISVVSFTAQGARQGERLKRLAKNYEVSCFTPKAEFASEQTEKIMGTLAVWCGVHFERADAMVFIGAAGIAVRSLAPLLRYKGTDPAVIVMDEQAIHMISLLSGHLGGGNALTMELSALMGADPVITTASDVNGKIAVDVFAKNNHLLISDMYHAKRAAAAIVNGDKVKFYCDGIVDGEIPPELTHVSEKQWKDMEARGIWVSPYLPERGSAPDDVLHLIPKCMVLGIGCKREKNFGEIESAVRKVLKEKGIAIESIAMMASVDIKKDEPGLLAFSEGYQIPFQTFSAEELKLVEGDFIPSAFVESVAGVDNVCERAAVCCAEKLAEGRRTYTIQKKVGKNGVTVALTSIEWRVSFE